MAGFCRDGYIIYNLMHSYIALYVLLLNGAALLTVKADYTYDRVSVKISKYVAIVLGYNKHFQFNLTDR